MRKRALALLLCIALILPMTFISVQAAEFSAYEAIPVNEYDDSKQVGSTPLNPKANMVGALRAGGWLCYKDVQFGDRLPYAVEVGIGAPQGYATAVEIRIDDPSGPVIASVPIIAGEWNTSVICKGTITQKITGAHDVYVTFNTSTANIFSLIFYGKADGEQKDFKYVEYKGLPSFGGLGNDAVGYAANMLVQLGILDSADSDTFDPILPVVRGEFAKVVHRIYEAPKKEDDMASEEEVRPAIQTGFTDVAPNSEYAEAVKYLSDIGVINGIGDGKFGPLEYISNIDALTVLLRVLGYDSIAELEGGYPNGYIKMAKRAKLSTGCADYDESLRYNGLIMLLARALSANYNQAVAFGADGYIDYETNEGILNKTQNIKSAIGTVIGTGVSGLTKPTTGLELNQVYIDNNVFYVGDTTAIGLLGFECEYFYEDNGDTKKLRAIVPTQDVEFLELSSKADEIHSITNSEITYTAAGEDKKKTIEITSETAILYNGVAIESTLTNILDSALNEKEFIGFIRYVENPNGSSVILIEEYRDYIVETVDVKRGIIDGIGDAPTLDISGSDNIIIVKDPLMENFEISKLKVDDVFTVYASKNEKGRKLIRIYLADDSVSGVVNKKDADNLYINNEPYVVSNYFDGTLSVGQEGSFKLNIYGDIVQIDQSAPSNWKIGLFMATNSADGVYGDVRAKIITDDGSLKIVSMPKILTADGIRVRDEETMLNGDGNKWIGLKNIIPETAIRYCTDGAGVLTRIDTPTTGTGGTLDTMKEFKRTQDKYRWYSSQATLISQSSTVPGGKYIFTDDSTVFSFFDTAVEARENRCAVGKPSVIFSQPFEAIGNIYSTTGSEYRADVFVWTDSTTALTWSALNDQVVVKDIISVLDENGEPAEVLRGWCNGKNMEYYIGDEIYADADKLQTLRSLKTGDLVLISRYPENVARDCVLRLSYDGSTERGATFDKGTNRTSGDANMETRSIYGKIIHKDDDYILVKTGEITDGDTQTDKYEVVNIKGAALTKVYSNGKDTFISSGITIDNIAVGDAAYVDIRTRNVRCVVVYETATL